MRPFSDQVESSRAPADTAGRFDQNLDRIGQTNYRDHRDHRDHRTNQVSRKNYEITDRAVQRGMTLVFASAVVNSANKYTPQANVNYSKSLRNSHNSSNRR